MNLEQTIDLYRDYRKNFTVDQQDKGIVNILSTFMDREITSEICRLSNELDSMKHEFLHIGAMPEQERGILCRKKRYVVTRLEYLISLSDYLHKEVL